MGDFTRQDMQRDVQLKLDQTVNRLLQRFATKQDLATLGDGIKDRLVTCLHDDSQMHQQQLLRQVTAYTDSVSKRVQIIESRIAGVEREIAVLEQMMMQLYKLQSASYTHSASTQPKFLVEQQTNPLKES